MKKEEYLIKIVKRVLEWTGLEKNEIQDWEEDISDLVMLELLDY